MFIYGDSHKKENDQRVNPSTIPPQDRRYLPRWHAKNRVIYKHADGPKPHECVSRDINCSGVSIWTDEDLMPNQKLNVTVYLSDQNKFTVDATVLWKKISKGQTLAGLQFSDVDEGVRDLIFNFAFEYNKDELMKRWYDGF